MTLVLPSSAEWAARCVSDSEFMLAARHWTGGLRLAIGDDALVLGLQEG